LVPRQVKDTLSVKTSSLGWQKSIVKDYYLHLMR
jgi:hypothetical protein